VEIMVQRLDMLSNFNEDYPHIYLRFLPIINNWQNKISQFSSDLQQDIKKIHLAHEPILLNQKLKIAKALTKLDKYVTCEKNKKIHDEYSLKLLSLFSFDPQDLTRCNDYTHAYETLLALDAINDSKLNHKKQKICEQLNESLKTLGEAIEYDVLILPPDIESKKILSVRNSINKLENARSKLDRYINEDTRKVLIGCRERIKKSISDRLTKFLDSINASIEGMAFLEAEEKCDTINVVEKLIGNYCDEQVRNSILNVHNDLDSKLKKVIENYLKMDITNYVYYPPKNIYEELMKVNRRHTKYINAWEQISRHIIYVFKGELEKCKQCTTTPNSHLRHLNTALKSLPVDMKLIFEDDLKYAEEKK